MQVQTKSVLIRDALLDRIKRGIYSSSKKLPAERKLAAEFGVSYMTARKAVSDLVDCDFLERRNRDGVFLSKNALDRLNNKVLNLICTAYDSSLITCFLRAAQEQGAKDNMKCQVIRVNLQNHKDAIVAMESDQPCLIFSGREFLENPFFVDVMKAHHQNIVLIGSNLSSVGIRSVICDDTSAIQLMVELLKKDNHKKIAFIAHTPNDSNEGLMIAKWKSCFVDQDPEEVESRLLVASTPMFESCASYVHNVVKEYLASDKADATAFICQMDESVIGAMAACRDAGLSVPEDISFIMHHDTPNARFLNPSITAVDPDISLHVKVAIQMLASSSPGDLRLINPKVVIRKSIKPMRMSRGKR